MPYISLSEDDVRKRVTKLQGSVTIMLAEVYAQDDLMISSQNLMTTVYVPAALLSSVYMLSFQALFFSISVRVSNSGLVGQAVQVFMTYTEEGHFGND